MMQKVTHDGYTVAERYDGDFEITLEDDLIGAADVRMRLPRALVMKLVRKLRKRTRNTKARVGDGGPSVASKLSCHGRLRSRFGLVCSHHAGPKARAQVRELRFRGSS